MTPITIYTAGYHQSSDLPPQAVNIACRSSALWQREGAGKSLGCLFPNSEVWAASKSGGDWKAAYMKQLAKHLKSGKLADAVRRLAEADVLMCWERSASDCHRPVAAEFIAANFPHVTYGGEYWSVAQARTKAATPQQLPLNFSK